MGKISKIISCIFIFSILLLSPVFAASEKISFSPASSTVYNNGIAQTVATITTDEDSKPEINKLNYTITPPSSSTSGSLSDYGFSVDNGTITFNGGSPVSDTPKPGAYTITASSGSITGNLSVTIKSVQNTLTIGSNTLYMTDSSNSKIENLTVNSAKPTSENVKALKATVYDSASKVSQAFNISFGSLAESTGTPTITISVASNIAEPGNYTVVLSQEVTGNSPSLLTGSFTITVEPMVYIRLLDKATSSSPNTTSFDATKIPGYSSSVSYDSEALSISGVSVKSSSRNTYLVEQTGNVNSSNYINFKSTNASLILGIISTPSSSEFLTPNSAQDIYYSYNSSTASTSVSNVNVGTIPASSVINNGFGSRVAVLDGSKLTFLGSTGNPNPFTITTTPENNTLTAKVSVNSTGSLGYGTYYVYLYSCQINQNGETVTGPDPTVGKETFEIFTFSVDSNITSTPSNLNSGNSVNNPLPIGLPYATTITYNSSIPANSTGDVQIIDINGNPAGASYTYRQVSGDSNSYTLTIQSLANGTYMVVPGYKRASNALATNTNTGNFTAVNSNSWFYIKTGGQEVIPVINRVEFTPDTASVYDLDKYLSQNPDAQKYQLVSTLGITPEGLQLTANNFTYTVRKASVSSGGVQLKSTPSASTYGFFYNDPGQTYPGLNNSQSGPYQQIYYDSKSAQVGTYVITASVKASNGVTLTDTVTVTVRSSTITNVNISYNGKNVTGKTLSLNRQDSKTVEFKYQTKPNVTKPNVNWYLTSSTNPNSTSNYYATVNPETGTVTLIRPTPPGKEVNLYCTVNGVTSQPVTISIADNETTLEGIQPFINPLTISNVPGEDTEVSANGNWTVPITDLDSMGNIRPIPFDATLPLPAVSNFTYKSLNPQIPINASTGAITVKPDEEVSGIIEVTSITNPDITTSFIIKITSPSEATGLSVQSRLTFGLQNRVATPATQNVGARLLPEGTTDMAEYSYESSNTRIATVDAYGNVTPVSTGSCTITTTATVGSETYEETTSVRITTPVACKGIDVEPETLELFLVGDNTATITCEVVPSNTTDPVTWYVKNPDICSISATSGNEITVTALNDGETGVVVDCGGYYQEIFVTVIGLVPAETIDITPDGADLTTLEGGTHSVDLTATITPENTTDELTWSISPESVATLSATEGDTVTVTAVSQGQATVTAQVGEISTSATINVSDNILLGDVSVEADSPDFFTVTADNLSVNKALSNTTINPKDVSMYVWSVTEDGTHKDINAKLVAESFPGSGSYVCEFPVNDTPINNYFLEADNIKINVYANADDGSSSLIYSSDYSWTDSQATTDEGVQYISYCQNIGFQKPTKFSGTIAGSETSGLGLEGIRVSSGIEGVEILSNVHIENIGWVYPQNSGQGYQDGQYAGTMERNLQLEAVELYLTGPNADNYDLTYRVYGHNYGWQSYVNEGQMAGTTGRNLQLEAIQIQLTPKSTQN